MAITAAMVKELREVSGAGMMDCKKALTATEGDMDKAMEFLREKGLATAQKKAGRIAAEGIVMLNVSEDGKKAVAVEVNAETDFVAKNEKFRGYVAQVAEQAMETEAADIDAFRTWEIRHQRDRWRRAGSSDRYHRREHEHPSFPAGKRGERFRCFLYSYGR